MENRYLRNKDLIDQNKLDKITIIGAGGIGSALILNAAIMGFKEMTIWDEDLLEEHNLSTTIYPENFLGQQKVSAAKHLVGQYNKNITVRPKEIFWESGYPLNNKVFLTPDNMEVRKRVYETWVQNDQRDFLIDMRMGALGFEIITVTKDEDKFMESWLPSTSIPDESCTAKHTIFCGSLAASYGLSQAFNLLDNRPYYSYIWGSLAPVCLKREHLVKNIK